MRRFLAIAVAAITISTGASFTAPAPAEAACIGVGGTGIGVTEGIARWMANKATVDSAKKWANGKRYSLSTVRIACSGLSCTGKAKACR